MSTKKQSNAAIINPSETLATKTLAKIKDSYLERLLDVSITYVGDGNAPDGSAFILSENKVFGLPSYRYLAYLITKIVVARRDYLPYRIKSASLYPTDTMTDVDDWREDALASIFTSLKNGDREHAINNAFKAVNDAMVTGNYTARNAKTLPKEEVLDVDFRQAVADLCALNPEGIKEYFTADFAVAVYKLFDSVKKAHKFASVNRWTAFEYYVLNVPNADIADTLGLSTQRVSAMNRETVEWFIDAVNEDATLSKYINLRV